jgi:hypothetical protein
MDQTKLLDNLSIDNELISSIGTFTATTIIVNIIFAALIGVSIAYVYKKFFLGVLFQKSFAASLILVTMITTLVIMVISGNLVLSLGMVGALSIVRFRAAIKDPLDVVYIFWAVGSGIAIGVSQYLLVVIGGASIAFMLLVLSKFNTVEQAKLFVISSKLNHQKKITAVIKNIDSHAVVRNTQVTRENIELVYETSGTSDIEKLFNKLKDVDPQAELRVLNYYGNN